MKFWLASLLLLSAVLSPAWAAGEAMGQVSRTGLAAILAPPLRPAPQGSSQADVTIVEYFDYQCPVCRRMEPDLARLVDSDLHVRIVHKDWPVFGAMSVYAAYCTLAAAQMGHYGTAHHALMSARVSLDSQEKIDAVLRAAGLDVAALQSYIAAHRMELSEVLTRNHGEARALGLAGTPGVIIGDRLVVGGLTLDQLRQLVAQARRSLQARD
jgi:protein-disulfide isomerase